ncbi:anthranilate synthase family protein [Streptomyces europaeiscabiei]|uniref:anthranilate synthase family protein n=1 Tax=Streptomyces europaeiscabiei TaxID=146819 RepID=UPI002E107A7E|nr:anthranilate synthase family protein [Streptomyces europaeiscabiei]WSG28340.1 anthranilate synthase family protein [Streptomyces europaeiscabiei]
MTGARPEGPPNGTLLDEILGAEPGPFALLHRPEANGPQLVDILVGEVSHPQTLSDIPLPEPGSAEGPRHDVLALVPYRQITERGFTAHDDNTPLVALSVTRQESAGLGTVLARLPEENIRTSGAHFDVDDDAYAETVRRIIADEIGTGEGANFVIKRTFVLDIGEYSPRSALTLFKRLLQREKGAYWTFVVHTGTRTLVGATPERHISVQDGTAVMNPISGTYRYPASGPTLPEVMDFLADRKETDELYMVVDEELKMMARICPDGGRVSGPFLKEMARLAHTEYFIEGRTAIDPREVLRETMFAPTVTGSPLESACRVIGRYEHGGRGYYSGVVALMGRDAAGGFALDSAICIRTADIDAAGQVRIGVGATLVRHSDPLSEVAETRAKAAGLLAALEGQGPTRFAAHPEVRRALEQRNETIAGFWLAGGPPAAERPLPPGLKVLVVDAEDTFTSMIGHQLHSLGLQVTVKRFDEPYRLAGHDLVVMGPGPGDPGDLSHPKIAHLDRTITTLLQEQRPFLAICLSHQVLSRRLGLDLRRRAVPNQGVQRDIDLFGRRERVGFYNTFAAVSCEDKTETDAAGVVEIARDTESLEVHALRGARFASMQFHPESVLTQNGVGITGDLVHGLLAGSRLAVAD